ncbi:probable Putative urea carboxylase [Cephalotrichum gorgonifer]|uniref:Probable Putative urea carboxylase n=1 Tax=Cephalotrichum gorgonifer TaxID=2041049 RepID=A0AAE8N817_9PEZI|nr:probable Putative urea carboxylase [Cephalotrichum gorgonifer]
MDALKVVLIANRGEIAVRLINAARLLGLWTVAIYTEPDVASSHVFLADKACLLDGPATSAYLDIDQIIEIAKDNGVDAVIPGYGFLSENPDFPRRLSQNGLTFIGPAADTIVSLGLKHTAREHAIRAGVPVIPGSDGLVDNEDDAAEIATRLGFPVMLKATAGGGGMGLLICETQDSVRSSFRKVQERSSALFKNSGVFVERFYPKSHHIEIQVFGNGLGNAISIGERECSIQRRHQKVIEECPSPYIENKMPELRQRLTKCAVRFAESVNYASAGTVEFLVDDETGDHFYLEMNTRLQVEHGITEMCYGVDLVELMYRQADAERAGRGGLTASFLEELQARTLVPNGHAIELRVCAENPARDYAPSPGILQQVEWFKLPGTRVDTWIQPGLSISASYDPLLGKIMHHAPTREQAVQNVIEVARRTVLTGPPNNLDFLVAILQSPAFVSGNTITAFLDDFDFSPAAIDVLSGGAYTTVQDYPGRPTLGRGFGHAGPMDPITFQIANMLVGNEPVVEALEITLSGPDLRFLGGAVIALCGAPVDATLDGEPMPLWTKTFVRAGQRLNIGKTASGARNYLAIRGGLPSVSKWFGSKATNPGVGIGGYQNRPLKAGDYLTLHPIPEEAPALLAPASLPESALVQFPEHWDIQVTGGPYEEGYLSPEDIDMIYTHTWKISHNAARGGIRLIGPRPTWARPDGGDGGSHPSNVIEWGYPLGGLNWTGDEPVIFPMDSPNFGGFLCSLTVIHADLWKIGQLRPGSTLRFHRVSISTALEARRENDRYLKGVAAALKTGSFEDVRPVRAQLSEVPQRCTDPAAVKVLEATAARPRVTYRQGGDNYLLVEYGTGSFDLNHKSRATALDRKLKEADSGISFKTGLINTVGCGTSLQIYYDGLQIPQATLMEYLVSLESKLGDLRNARIANRTFHLPLTFTHKKIPDAIERYMTNQRREAPYLPDNFDFVARNNGISREELKDVFLKAEFVAVGVGFVMALPQCLPADPRHRLRSPKKNPSRTYTPAGAVSWGGSCMALYNADGPGGYMLTGLTIPGVDVMGSKDGFSPERPWLFEDMDVITFYEVTEDEYEKEMALWRSGRYQYKMRETHFDMAEHNKLLEDTRDEVEAMRSRQMESEAEMQRLEKESWAKCLEDQAGGQASSDRIEALMADPAIEALEAPVNAKVWKVHVHKDEKLRTAQVVVVLEAMKMEINVHVDPGFEGYVVEEVLYLESLPVLENIIQSRLRAGASSKRRRPEGETARVWDDILHDQFPGRDGYSSGPEMLLNVDGAGKADLFTSRISQDGHFSEKKFFVVECKAPGLETRRST